MHDELIAQKLSSMAHPARLAIVRMLAKAGPPGLPAGQLGESLGIASNALTFHLHKLASVGLIGSRRNGQFVIYSVVFDALLELTDYLVGACCVDSTEKCDPCCESAERTPAPLAHIRRSKTS